MTDRFPRRAAVQLGAGLLVFALLAAMGAGIFHIGEAMAGVAQRRSAMLAAGVDTMPVGTSRQVDRAKQARAVKP